MAVLDFDPAGAALFLPFDGCHNFRSVAGWRTVDGRNVVPDRIYRADGLDRLTDVDHERLLKLRVSHVFDLRAAKEKGEAPSRWPEGFSAKVWADAESAAEANIMQVMAQAEPKVEQFREAMRSVYAHLPDELADAVRAAAEALLAPDCGAILIHCSAGKDRTGFVTSALLYALGVRADDVLADYLLSNACFETAVRRFGADGRFDALNALAPGSLEALVGVDSEYLGASMGSIAESHDTFDAWLEQRAGVDRDMRAALQERMLA